jgi:hypothetical protein
MKRRRPAKGFDCIAFKSKAQAEIYEEIKGLSPEEEIAYFRRRAAAGPLSKLWKALEPRAETEPGSEALPTVAAQHQLTLK